MPGAAGRGVWRVGGDVYRLRDVPGAAWKEYLRIRAAQVAPIFERSGVGSWPLFCVRFAHSFPQVRATVGSTSSPERLSGLCAAATGVQPLPREIVDEIAALQRGWSADVDVQAEPWSMGWVYPRRDGRTGPGRAVLPTP